MIAAVSEEMIDAIALTGTPEDVRSGIARYEGLLDHVILYAASFEIAPERAVENARALVEHCGASGASRD
jgi:hypothetical protein